MSRGGLDGSRCRRGDYFIGIEKGQGLKAGETQVCMGVNRCVSVRTERADAILTYEDPADELRREGFAGMDAQEFVDHLCQMNSIKPADTIRRIEFHKFHGHRLPHRPGWYAHHWHGRWQDGYVCPLQVNGDSEEAWELIAVAVDDRMCCRFIDSMLPDAGLWYWARDEQEQQLLMQTLPKVAA